MNLRMPNHSILSENIWNWLSGYKREYPVTEVENITGRLTGYLVTVS